MGAWSEHPLGNDEAQEWIANTITRPMIDSIAATLDRFLAESSDDANKAQAEAAAALLIDLAQLSNCNNYVQFDGGFIASELGVWGKATKAIKLLTLEKEWLANWNNPQKKTDVLIQLLADLEVATKRAKDNESPSEV